MPATRSVRTIGVMLWAGTSVSCFTRLTYECQTQDECVVDGEAGVCEMQGFCSFEDGDCGTGRRFSEFAAPGLAGACVPVDDGTSTGSGGDVTHATTMVSTTTATDATAGDTADTGVAAGCGDGTVQDPETCDDGNLVDGDGCNADCQPSGRVLWARTDDAAAPVDVRGLAADGDALTVVGSDAAGAFAARYDGVAGDPVWRGTLDPSRATEALALGVAVAAEGDVVVAGEETAGTLRGVVHRLDPDGLPVWSARYDTLGDESLAAVGVDDADRAFAVGMTGDEYLLRRYDGSGTLVSTTGITVGDEATARAIDVLGNGGAIVAGDIAAGDGGRNLVVRRVNAGGGVTLAIDPTGAPSSDDRAYGVADSPLGGTVVVGQVGGTGWVGWFGAGGQPVATYTLDGDSLLGAVAVGPDGDTFAAGWVWDAGQRDVWVGRLGPDGALRWQTPIPAAEGDDEARGIAVADDGSVFVAGQTTVGGAAQVWLARLAP